MSDNILNKRNDFIYFDDKSNSIKLTPQSEAFGVVKDLNRRDRSFGKKFVLKCLKMVYYLHHKDSPIAHLSVEMKKNDIVNISDDLKDFDFNNEAYVNFEKFFIKTHYSRIELRYLQFIKDIDDVRDSLIEMPTKVRKSINKVIMIGEESHKISEIIEYDNQLDKVKAINGLISLDKLERILKDKIEEEYKSKKSNSRRLFDQ